MTNETKQGLRFLLNARGGRLHFMVSVCEGELRWDVSSDAWDEDQNPSSLDELVAELVEHQVARLEEQAREIEAKLCLLRPAEAAE